MGLRLTFDGSIGMPGVTVGENVDCPAACELISDSGLVRPPPVVECELADPMREIICWTGASRSGPSASFPGMKRPSICIVGIASC